MEGGRKVQIRKMYFGMTLETFTTIVSVILRIELSSKQIVLASFPGRLDSVVGTYVLLGTRHVPPLCVRSRYVLHAFAKYISVRV